MDGSIEIYEIVVFAVQESCIAMMCENIGFSETVPFTTINQDAGVA
jgi:hypothetical protein